ncbi:MAG: hypothetical protein WC070_00590 [Candidatus Magasanikbacteria bacterium]
MERRNPEHSFSTGAKKVEEKEKKKSLRERLINKWTLLFTALTVFAGHEISSAEKNKYNDDFAERLPQDPESLAEIDKALDIVEEAIQERTQRQKNKDVEEEQLEKLARGIQREHGWKGDQEKALVDLTDIPKKEELPSNQMFKEDYQAIFDALPNKNFNLAPIELGYLNYLITNSQDDFEAELDFEHEVVKPEEDDKDTSEYVVSNYKLTVGLEGKTQEFVAGTLQEVAKLVSYTHDLHSLWKFYESGVLTEEQYQNDKKELQTKHGFN